MIFLICLLITTGPVLLDITDVILYTGGEHGFNYTITNDIRRLECPL